MEKEQTVEYNSYNGGSLCLRCDVMTTLINDNLKIKGV